MKPAKSPVKKKRKPYTKPHLKSERVPLGGLHAVVCDGGGHGGTKIDTLSGCGADRLLS